MLDSVLAVVRDSPLVIGMSFLVLIIAGALTASLYGLARENRAHALQRELTRLQKEADRLKDRF